MIRIRKSNGTQLRIRKNGASYIVRLFNSIYKEIVSLFKTRVMTDGGTFEAETKLENQLNTLGSTLFDSASLVITPNGVKTSKLYSIKPNDGTGDLTVTRSTTATRVNEQGLVELVPYNLLSYSEDFSNSYWVKTNYTVVPNSGISPIGTMTASLIVPSISGGGFRNTTVNGVGGETHIWSCYIKSNGLRYVALTAWNSDDPVTNFDLQNGVIVSQSGPPSTAKITNVGNGWYLCEVSRVLRKDSLGIWLRIGVTNLNGSNLNGSNGYLIWGAQVVRSNEPKPYQLTTNRLNIPRIDYTTGQPAILVEPQRTNLIVRSEEFENASWQKNNSSIIPNATISPSGLMNADKLVENNLLATHSIHLYLGGTELRTNSIFVKAGERSRFILWAGASGCMFDLINLTTTPGNNFQSISNTSIQDYGNGWYRCSITTNAGTNNGYSISLLDNKTNPITPTPQYQGNGVSGLYIWGAQRENASSLTSYIPTTTSTVTRNADVISKTGLSGITSITENFENGTTNVISGNPTNYTMSQGRIKQVLGL